MAKDGQSIHAICGFFECYSYPVVQKLKELIVRYSVVRIIIARIRLQRIVELNWHPFEFWQYCAQRAVTELLREKLIEHDVAIQIFLPAGFVRRSSLSSTKRRKGLLTFRKKTQKNGFGFVENMSGSALILDDVLTSGGTLLKEVMDAQVHGTQEPGSLFHALTLFRTPSSQSPVDEKALDELDSFFCQSTAAQNPNGMPSRK